MNTTLQQIHLNGEVIDLTEFAKEQTLTDGVNTLSDKIDNLSTTMENNYAQQLANIIG